LYLTVTKWRSEAVIDDFDRGIVGSQSCFDDVPYTGDPRRFLEVIITCLLMYTFYNNVLSFMFKMYCKCGCVKSDLDRTQIQ